MKVTKINLLDIRSNDIKNWAENSEASSELPEIIKKLVYTASNQIDKIKFLSREDNNNPGWDGIVNNTGVHPHIPSGCSFWEIGTNKRPKKKADEDYNKRTLQTEESIRRESTFVFVTPRPWRNKEQWIQTKREREEWKDIRVIDCNDLTSWINQQLTIKLIFLEKHLGQHLDGIHSLEYAWNKWTRYTIIDLPPLLFKKEVFLSKEKLITWFRNKTGSSFVISADSLLEGIAFLKCLLDEPEFEQIRDNVAYLSNEESAINLFTYQPECIAVITDERLAESCLAAGCKQIVQIYTKGIPRNDIDVTLGILEYNIVRDFCKAGKNLPIEQIAKNCGYNRVLIRQALSKAKTTPKWTTDKSYLSIIRALAFLEYIDSKNKEHQNSVLSLSANEIEEFREFRRIFNKLWKEDETPVWSAKYESYAASPTNLYGVHSQMESLRYISTEIDEGFILKLESLINKIYFEDYDKFQINSRRSVLSALIICNEYGIEWEIPAYDSLSSLSKRITEKTLEICKKEHASKHLTQLLDYFAELSPDLFVENLSSFNACWQQMGGALDAALHILGKHPKYFHKITATLAEWYHCCEEETSKNRIVEILKAFFLCSFPQTNAAVMTRIQVTQKLKKISPELCWAVCIQQFYLYTITTPIYPSARFRRSISLWQLNECVSISDARKYKEFAFEQIVDTCKSDYNRTVKLISILPDIPVEHHKNIWDKILTSFASFTKSQQGKICYVSFLIAHDLHKFHNMQKARSIALCAIKRISSSNPFLQNLEHFFYKYSNNDEKLISKCEKILVKCKNLSIDIFQYTLLIDKINFHLIGTIYSKFVDFHFLDFCRTHFSDANTSQSQLFHFIKGYTVKWKGCDLVRFVKDIFSFLPDAETKAKFALVFSYSIDVCSFIQLLKDDTKNKFWELHPGIFIINHSKETALMLKYAVANGRADLALEAVLYPRENSDLTLQRDMLSAYAKQVWNDGKIVYVSELPLLLANLYKGSLLSLLQCAYIEYRLGYHIASEPEYSYPFISQYLAEHPERFSLIINKINGRDRDFQDNTYIRISSRWASIHDKITIPIYAKNLLSWCNTVFNQSQLSSEITSQIIGATLVAGPASQIRKWLSPDICRCIEQYYDDNLVSGFCLALITRRGVLSRPVDAGGIHEHRLIQYLKSYIDDSLSAYPHTCSLLQSFISYLTSEASRSDVNAILMKH